MPENYYDLINERIEDEPIFEAQDTGEKAERKNRRTRRKEEGKGPRRPLKVSESKEISEEESKIAGKQAVPEMAAAEQVSGGKEKLKEGIKRLKEYTANRANELRERGIMVDDGGRVDPLAFKGDLKSTAVYHSRQAKEIESGFDNRGGDRKMKEMSECMEMLVTDLLSRVLGDGYVVCRSSKYDDYVNKSDNVVIRKCDGRVIGTIDDAIRSVSRLKPESVDFFAEKKTEVEEQNAIGGATIRYCYGKESEEDAGLVEKEQRGVPLFYIGLTFRELIDGLSDFGLSKERPASHQEILDKIFSSLSNQMPILARMGFDISSFEADFNNIAKKEGINVESESGCYVAYGKRGAAGSGRLAAA